MDADTLAAQAYSEWEHADQAARAEEERLTDAWLHYTLGASAPPDELKAEARRLRELAEMKLSAALALMAPPVVGQELHTPLKMPGRTRWRNALRSRRW
ncbi:hypothetical protein GCM10028796_37840 [Ramlibacter monticola]